jgi:predicted nucleic acid-binding protein
MILLDTNVVIDARDSSQAYHAWAVRQIEQALTGGGGAINVVTLAELCAGSPNAAEIEPEIRTLGLQILELPAAAGTACGAAYRRYAAARRASGGGPASRTPLPDFFIGAHAEVLGCKLATRDAGRIAAYFPGVGLVTPKK